MNEPMLEQTREATFEHKCRRCGAVALGLNGPAGCAETVLRDVVYRSFDGRNAEPRMVETHRCADGGEGITDFIGYRVNERNL